MAQTKKQKAERARDLRLQREYTWTLEGYKKVEKFQNYCCAICKRHKSNFKTNLAIDHDHVTGVVRGLLCMTCNRALAKFQDNVEKLQAAALYLISNPVEQALGKKIITAPGRVGTKVRAKKLKLLQGKTK